LGMITTLFLYTLLGLATSYYLAQFLDESSPKIQYNRIIKPQANSFSAHNMGAYFFFLIGNPASKLLPATESDGVTTDDSSDNAGVRRRILQSTASKNLYLKLSEVSKYFVTTLTQEVIQFQTNPAGGEDYQVVQAINKTLIPCTQAAWFNDPQFADALKENEFVNHLITKYGICIQLEDTVKIFGDQLSRKSSRLRFKLEYCDSATTCLSSSFDDVSNSDGLHMVVGSFEPAVDNSNKTNPWSYALNVDTQIGIEALSTATVTVALKSIECLTDKGAVISDVDNLTRAAIDMVRKDFTSSFQFGQDITSLLTTTPSYDQYSVQYIPANVSYVDIRIVASRTTEQFQRTYDTILDLFGNIGGSLDFVIIIFVILFNWLENILTDHTVMTQMASALQVPQKMLGKSKKRAWCGKKNRTKPNELELKEEETKIGGCKEALAEICEKSLSVENIAIQATTYEMMIESMVPAHLRTLMPLTVFMKKLIEQKKSQEKEKLKKSNAVSKAAESTAVYKQTSSKELIPVAEQHEEKLSVAEAFDNLNSSTDPLFSGMNQEIKTVFVEFATLFGIRNMKAFLQEECASEPSEREHGRIEDINYKMQPAQQSVELSNMQLAKYERDADIMSLKKSRLTEVFPGPVPATELPSLIQQT
jgi:hypothetical protein